MERTEISIHEVRLFAFMEQNAARWVTSKEAAAGAKIAERTARAHLLKLVGMNLIDQAEVFPGHRYQLSKLASKRNTGYVTRLRRATEALTSV
jgi:hypothetical protein